MSTGAETTHHEYSAPVGFLELFYDLVFVAATMVLSNWLSHTPSWQDAGTGVLMFVLLWLLWFHTTMLMNVERSDDLGQRALVFAQMFVIFLSALAFVDHAERTVDIVGITYPIAVLLVAWLFHRARATDGPAGIWLLAHRNRLLFAAAVMVIGTFVEGEGDALLSILAIALLVFPTRRRVRRATQSVLDAHHLTERAALLTLVVLGEAFVKTALVISAGEIDLWDASAVAVMFAILFGVFSLYFDDVPRAGIRSGTLAHELWLLAHIVLQVSIVALAVGVSKYLQTGGDNAPDSAVVIVMIAFVGIMAGLAIIAAFDRRVPRVPMLLSRLVAIVITIVCAIVTLRVDSFVPGTFLLELGVLSLAMGVISWRLRLRTTVESPEPLDLLEPFEPPIALDPVSEPAQEIDR